MKFIRVNTRLFCDLYEAFRGLTKDSRLSVWAEKLGEHITIGNETFKMNIENDEPYTTVVWHLPESSLTLTFNLMKCAAKTEYCTEVHLMLAPDQGDELEASHIEQATILGKGLLEQLRVHYNKDWVILDTDLSLSQLRGSI